jgi:O-glycosyl hydrolase
VTRRPRLCRLTAVYVLGLFLFPQSIALADSGRIDPRPAQTFRGWGTSLAWEANDLYGGGRQPAQIKDPKIQSQYMDLLFGDPATRLTLGFNVARYNIGGGDDPTHKHMRADAQMDGFQDRPNAPFDWTRDASQRRMLQEAKKRGANILEAFSNSPPYWMTVSGCASGSTVARQDNLRPEMYQNFVNYLATVVKHFRDAEGIRFESVEAFNEPDIGWTARGRQEGNSASFASQNALIPMLEGRLKHDSLDTLVSGVDMNNVNDAVGGVAMLTPAAFSALGRMNTHDYHFVTADPEKMADYKSVAQKAHKPVWMSEVGCCFQNQGDGTDMWGALFMADTMRMDLRDLGAVSWVLWQPDWGVILFDPNGRTPQLKKQYYAIAQYSRFIRPGFQIISAGGAYNTLAAYSHSSKRLVLVSTSWDAATPNDLDLSAFEDIPASVTVYRTTADESVNLEEGSIKISSKKHIVDQLPVRSITTYVVDGITPLPNAPSSEMEGLHQIVSQGTKLCMNIPRNSTKSGEGIIPYPCSALGNMEFNFVDKGGGFYSIQTVNDAQRLCLNIADASSLPGDGKKLGGPGNLIQWACGEGAAFYPNELFELVDLGGNKFQIRVKSSGLCLEDPGRGGTIRQDRCNKSNGNQQFHLK